MVAERTLLIIKPDGVQRGLAGTIISRWERLGYKIVGIKTIKASVEQAAAHYAEHSTKGFFNALVNFLSSAPIILIAVEGADVIAKSRFMIGQTNPLQSAPGTIRGDFGTSVDNNIIHGSDSVESAQRELAMWFTLEELLQ